MEFELEGRGEPGILAAIRLKGPSRRPDSVYAWNEAHVGETLVTRKAASFHVNSIGKKLEIRQTYNGHLCKFIYQ